MLAFQSLCAYSSHLREYSPPRCLHGLLLHFIEVKCSSSELFSKIIQCSHLLIFTVTFHCLIFHLGSFNLLILLMTAIPPETWLDISDRVVKETNQISSLIELMFLMENNAVWEVFRVRLHDHVGSQWGDPFHKYWEVSEKDSSINSLFRRWS